MAEAVIDPASTTTLALSHSHQDHAQRLLPPDPRVLSLSGGRRDLVRRSDAYAYKPAVG
jgi:hypothetical protein